MGCGIAGFGWMTLKPLKFYNLDLEVCPQGPCAPSFEVPGYKLWDHNCQVLGVYRPLRPKQAIPHPISIQNMRFDR